MSISCRGVISVAHNVEVVYWSNQDLFYIKDYLLTHFFVQAILDEINALIVQCHYFHILSD